MRDESNPEFVWVDITSSGTQVVGAGLNIWSNSEPPDGIAESVPLPLPFPFYGTDGIEIVPCSNGYLSTDPNEDGKDSKSACPPSQPNSGRGGRIYALHAPFDLQGGIYCQYFELSPHPHGCCGVSVFTWQDAIETSKGARVAFQALLFDNGDIITQYSGGNSGAIDNATVGIQDPTAAEGLSYHCGALASAPAGLAVLFRAPEVVITQGTDLADAIALVRNGGKVRFTNDGNPNTDDQIEVPATVVIDKSVHA